MDCLGGGSRHPIFYYFDIRLNRLEMPYMLLEKGKGRYSVINSMTGKVHAADTTKAKAEAQIRLLRGVEAGSLKPRKK